MLCFGLECITIELVMIVIYDFAVYFTHSFDVKSKLLLFCFRLDSCSIVIHTWSRVARACAECHAWLHRVCRREVEVSLVEQREKKTAFLKLRIAFFSYVATCDSLSLLFLRCFCSCERKSAGSSWILFRVACRRLASAVSRLKSSRKWLVRLVTSGEAV